MQKPRSVYDEAGGLVYFPRMLDKIRLHAKGELPGDYLANLGGGADRRCCGFLRIDYSALRERVLAGGSDEEVLQWAYEKGRPLDEGDVFIWNMFLTKFGWNDVVTPHFVEGKQAAGFADRDDIQTISQLIEVEEGRRP